MIQGLMHALNELKTRQEHILTRLPDTLVASVTGDFIEWIQGEIDKEIDALVEHHSHTTERLERESAEVPKDISEMTDKEWQERNDPPSQS